MSVGGRVGMANVRAGIDVVVPIDFWDLPPCHPLEEES